MEEAFLQKCLKRHSLMHSDLLLHHHLPFIGCAPTPSVGRSDSGDAVGFEMFFFFFSFFFLLLSRARRDTGNNSKNHFLPHDASPCHFRPRSWRGFKYLLMSPPGCETSFFFLSDCLTLYLQPFHISTIPTCHSLGKESLKSDLLHRVIYTSISYIHHGADICWHVRQAPWVDGVNHRNHGFPALRLRS